MKRCHLYVLTVAMLFGLSFSLVAKANVLLYSTNLNTTGVNGLGISFTTLHPFDTSLGTLDSVDMNFIGSLSVTGTLFPSVTFGPFGSTRYLPYSYFIDVTQSLDGLLGFNNFGFANPAHFFYSGVSSGTGESFYYTSNYEYNLSFNNITDLAGGFTVPSRSFSTISPGYVTGLRKDFYESPTYGSTGLMLQNTLTTSINSPYAINPTVNMVNVLTITYHYTPFENVDPGPSSGPGPGQGSGPGTGQGYGPAPGPQPGTTTVPEPNSLILLFTGLALLLLINRPGLRIRKRSTNPEGILECSDSSFPRNIILSNSQS